MSAEETELELCRIRDLLEDYVKEDAEDASEALEYFEKLKQLPITLDLLQKTRIGVTLNQYRKATKHDEVSNQAKELIKEWRKLVPSTPGESESTPASSGKKVKRGYSETDDRSETSTSNSKGSHSKLDKSRDREKDAGGKSGKDSKDGKVRESDVKRPKTNVVPESTPKPSMSLHESIDPSRIKCRELIEKALLTSEGPAPDEARVAEATACARRIEEAVFGDCDSSVSQRYRTRIISRVQNLKDAKNPQLREAVLCGNLDPERLARMTSEEMASPELKLLRRQYEVETMDNSRMAFTSGTKSSLLKCNRCQKQNVTYNQMQTRSSDEPMTTFCFCNECGHRWKFC